MADGVYRGTDHSYPADGVPATFSFVAQSGGDWAFYVPRVASGWQCPASVVLIDGQISPKWE